LGQEKEEEKEEEKDDEKEKEEEREEDGKGEEEENNYGKEGGGMSTRGGALTGFEGDLRQPEGRWNENIFDVKCGRG
jgi:hypothetical protein